MRLPVISATAFAAMALIATVASATAEQARQFLSAPFLCTDGAPLPSFSQTNQRYLHEFKDFTETRHQACALVEAFQILRQGPPPLKKECQTFTLVSCTVMCRGGAVSAARWWAASEQGQRSGARIAGNTLHVAFRGGGGWSVGAGGPGVTGMRVAERTASFAALPSGFGFSLNLPVQTLTLPWSSFEKSLPAEAPASLHRPQPVPAWVQVFADWRPWPQLLIGLAVLGYGLIALVGLRTSPSTSLQRSGLVIMFGLALYSVSLTHVPAGIPGEAHAAAQNDIERARSNKLELARIVRLSSTTHMVEPIATDDVKRIAQLMRPVVIADIDVQPAQWLMGFLLPALLAAIVFVLPFLRGWHYLFVRHPAAIAIAPQLRTGALFEAQMLREALRPNPADLDTHPPAYKSWNLFERARALKDKINADADIADAAMRRDRARAQKMQAEADLREARRKLPWWQRWWS